MANNYFDENGNYINVENLSLADIYHRAFALGVESTPIKDERKHGKWMKKEWGYICSACNETNDFAYDNNIHKFVDNYCPHCGAKMDAEE